MEVCKEGAMCDAGIITAGHKVKYYEIAFYGTLRQFAETLGLDDAVVLFKIKKIFSFCMRPVLKNWNRLC